ncbi:MAG: hypothetical protein KGJ43_05685, partial [Acidobacteriota bacterium]|nr:hypothetical protein [Acidobacteriota bacterium]
MRALLATPAAVALLAGCGAGVASPDLFAITRAASGGAPNLTMVVSEEGGVSCNGARAGMLSDPQIIEARTIAEDLHGTVPHDLSLAPRAGSVRSYRVRDPDGQISFADNSLAGPKVTRVLDR